MKPDNFFSVQCFYFRLSLVTVPWQNRFFFSKGDEFVTYFRVSFLGPLPEPRHARWMAFAENSSSTIWCWNTLILDPSPFLLFWSERQNQSKSFLCLKLLRCLLDQYASCILWQQGMSDECDMLCFLLGKAGSVSGLVIVAVSVWFFQQMASICWSSVLCFERKSLANFMMQSNTVGHENYIPFITSGIIHLMIWCQLCISGCLKKSACDKVLIWRENLEINYYLLTFRCFYVECSIPVK